MGRELLAWAPPRVPRFSGPSRAGGSAGGGHRCAVTGGHGAVLVPRASASHASILRAQLASESSALTMMGAHLLTAEDS